MSDFSPHGRGVTGADGRPVPGVLGKSFLCPPYSVLNAHTAWWINRKNAWLALGLLPAAGRRAGGTEGSASVNGLTYGMNPDAYKGEVRERTKTPGIVPARPKLRKLVNGGTSAFDPVLCELMLRWFCPEAGGVLDPFCGGPTLAVVSAMLGREFLGVELREGQVDATVEQCERTLGELRGRVIIRWDSAFQALADMTPATDFVFTSPPYFDLERYSTEGDDLSNCKSYGDYLDDMEGVGKQLFRVLRNNRFCALLLGDVRDEGGFARGLPGDVCRRFRRAGFRLYNEIVYHGSKGGSMRLRAGRQFDHSRKVGRIHQTCFVFVKGDPVKATRAVKEEP